MEHEWEWSVFAQAYKCGNCLTVSHNPDEEQTCGEVLAVDYSPGRHQDNSRWRKYTIEELMDSV